MDENRPNSDSLSFSYVHKKSERLAIAIHIITDHIDENQKLMSLLRETSLSLLEHVLSLSRSGIVKGGDRISGTITKLKSLLLIAYQCGYISEANYRLLESDFLELDLFVVSHREQIGAPVLTQTFLQVPEPKLEHHVAPKTSQRQIQRTNTPKKSNGTKHSERRKIILELLNRKDKINVKDVSEIIDNCSEKTIQRELTSLVKRGVLKKEGERRWSVYMLANSG